MAALVLPFPRALDRRYVERQAAYAATLRHEKAIKPLARQLELQRSVMLRRGLEQRRIEIELDRLEMAFVSALRRYGLAGTGGAAS